MEATEETQRPEGRGKAPKKKSPKKARDVKLTLRLTRAERKCIRLYAVECELETNELILRWYRRRELLAKGKAMESSGTEDTGRVAS